MPIALFKRSPADVFLIVKGPTIPFVKFSAAIVVAKVVKFPHSAFTASSNFKFKAKNFFCAVSRIARVGSVPAGEFCKNAPRRVELRPIAV